MEMKLPLLLDAEHAGLVEFASGERSRYALQGIHYRAETRCLEATDGKILAILSTGDAADYPNIDGVPPAPTENTLIPINLLAKAAKDAPRKTSKRVLDGSYLLGRENGRITCASTDLETVNQASAPVVGGRFPVVTEEIPKDAEPATLEILLAPDILAKLIGYAKRHGRQGSAIQFRFYGPQKVVRFDMPTEQGRTLTGVFMPVVPESVS